MKPHQWRRGPAGRYLRHLPRIKHLRGSWLHRKLGERFFAHEMWQPDRPRFAAGCAIGVFFSMMPFPFQMLAAALIAYLIRVNIPVSIASTWVSNPLTTPFILLGQYELGCALMGRTPVSEPGVDMLKLLSQAPLPLLIGALITGAVSSLAACFLALKGWDWFVGRHLKPRTLEGGKKPPATTKNPL